MQYTKPPLITSDHLMCEVQCIIFLAALSSSRSVVVRWSVGPSVRWSEVFVKK